MNDEEGVEVRRNDEERAHDPDEAQLPCVIFPKLLF